MTPLLHREPLRRLVLLSILTLAVPLSALAQEPAASASEERSEGSEPADRGFEPLLPEDQLFEGDTWVKLGDRLLESLIDVIPRLLAALVVLGAFLILALVLAAVVQKALARTRADPALKYMAARLVKISIVVLGITMAAAQAGIQVGSLIAGVGIAGLAVGLAAQDSLSNVVAGFTVLWDRPFRTGDRVTIADRYGEVIAVGLRSTRLRTVNHLDVIIPNRTVVENMIINHTLNPQLRLDVPLGIAYREDSRQARDALLASAAHSSFVAAAPEPEVVVTGLGDSSVDLQLRVWLEDPAQERAAMCDLLERSKIALDEAGIEIPFPQRTLHFPGEGPPLRHVGSERAQES